MRNTICFLLLIVVCFSCKKEEVKKNLQPSKIVVKEFQKIIDEANVSGSILMYDVQEKKWFSNDFDWASIGRLPASTYKITNSIIALETGVVENDSTILKWNGEERRMKIWEQDLIFRKAFHYSCVPCYQEIARKIGVERMNLYLNKLQYHDMKVDSTSIDTFWLVGDSKINQYEQIDFLKRFYESKLPIAKRTENIMKKLMVIEENNRYKISGKTGWAIRNGNNNGWFVGYIEVKNKVYYFATNIAPKESFNMDLFPKIRKEITHKALEYMKVL